MKISETMDLNELAERVGGCTVSEYREFLVTLRDALVDEFDGMDTADVPEARWLHLIDTAAPL